MEKSDRKYKVDKSCEKYKSYDQNVWSLEFFDKKTGGYVVVNRKRLANAIKYKNEGTKFKDEFSMAKVFAAGGHQMEMLEEVPRIPSPDVNINGIPADLKYPKNVNNIVKDARKAIKKQGAKLVLLKLVGRTLDVRRRIKSLSKLGVHGKYYIKGEEEKIYDF